MPRTPEDILDELLVLRVQDGEPESLETLTLRWQPRLLRHALRLTTDHDAAAEIVQEAWVAAIRGIRRLRDPAMFRGWVYGILSNKAADWVRCRQRTRQMHISFETNEPDVASNDSDISQRECRDRQIEELRAAMALLSIDHRAVLSMHYGEEMSVEEISRALAIPEGTVKSRLHHARERLRRTLEAKGHMS